MLHTPNFSTECEKKVFLLKREKEFSSLSVRAEMNLVATAALMCVRARAAAAAPLQDAGALARLPNQ